MKYLIINKRNYTCEAFKNVLRSSDDTLNHLQVSRKQNFSGENVLHLTDQFTDFERFF